VCRRVVVLLCASKHADDEDTREMLGMLLERYGATVRPVAMATAAVAALKRR